MVANLVPHYFGLALPMAFTAAIFIAAARMSDDCELDIMLTTGRSIARIATPYFALAVLLIPFSAYLFGQVQPVTRYGYRLAVYDAMQTGWNAKVEENRFIDAGKGATFSAREVAPDGRHLRGVFVERRNPSGGIEITTAVDGQFVPGPGGHGISLRLEHGTRLVEGADHAVSIEHFDESRIDRNLLPARQPFRERGESARERTQPELWSDIRRGGDNKAAAEFHGRLPRKIHRPSAANRTYGVHTASAAGARPLAARLSPNCSAWCTRISATVANTTPGARWPRLDAMPSGRASSGSSGSSITRASRPWNSAAALLSPPRRMSLQSSGWVRSRADSPRSRKGWRAGSRLRSIRLWSNCSIDTAWSAPSTSRMPFSSRRLIPWPPGPATNWPSTAVVISMLPPAPRRSTKTPRRCRPSGATSRALKVAPLPASMNRFSSTFAFQPVCIASYTASR